LSGKLTIGTNTPSLNGQFNTAGAATIITPRKGLSTLTTTLQLDFADQSVQGTVGDGSFLASLAGDQEVFSSSQKAANYYEGQYTLIIAGVNDAAVGPFGASYGTVSVVPAGTITFSGSLADGTAVGPITSFVSKDGKWPFYLALYGGNGSFWSWNTFTFNDGAIAGSTNASWLNATNTAKAAVNRSGFTNQQTTLTGGLYLPSLTLPTGWTAILEGGNLPFAITNGVTISASDQISLTNSVDETNKLILTINKTTGAISGSFANPGQPKQTIKVNGVILQGQTSAQGYFLGTNQSGAFLIENQ
jgi:hypothetical protein